MQILCSYYSVFSRGGHKWERCLPKIRFLTSFCSSSFLYSNIPWKSFSFRGMLTGRIGSSMICPGDMFSIWPTSEGKWKEILCFQWNPMHNKGNCISKGELQHREMGFFGFRVALYNKNPIKENDADKCIFEWHSSSKEEWKPVNSIH